MIVSKNTKHFACKECLSQAIDFFCKEKTRLFLEVTVKYEDQEETIIIRREIIAHWFGYDFYNESKVKNIQKPQTKEEVIGLWDCLTINGEPIKKANEKWNNYLQL